MLSPFYAPILSSAWGDHDIDFTIDFTLARSVPKDRLAWLLPVVDDVGNTVWRHVRWSLLTVEHVSQMSFPRSPMLVTLLPVLLCGCQALELGVANHAGPVAAEQWRLFLIVAAVLGFVIMPVLILVPLVAWHYRRSNKGDAYRPNWGFSWPLEILVWIPPVGIVIGLGFLLWSSTHQLDPYRPLPSAQPPIEVQAVALDWKWLFIYPEEGVAAVDQLAIPTDRPVHITLTSGTVMQSLLIPQLAGQIYAMAGMQTQLNVAANRAGVFRGQNTQYNGNGFPDQKFNVLAMEPGDYDRWLAQIRASARPLDDQALRQVTTRSVAPRPIFFSTVPPGLFHRMMIESTQEPER